MAPNCGRPIPIESCSAEPPVIRGRDRSHASHCLFVRAREPFCASHFCPCSPWGPPKGGDEVAGDTVSIPGCACLDLCRVLPHTCVLSPEGGLAPLVSTLTMARASGGRMPSQQGPRHTASRDENRRVSAQSAGAPSPPWHAASPGSPPSGRRSLGGLDHGAAPATPFRPAHGASDSRLDG